MIERFQSNAFWSRTVLAVAVGIAGPQLPYTDAQAETRWLNDAEIEQVVKGHTLSGVYAGGRRFSESYLENGRLRYEEDGATLSGRWSIAAGALCTIYDTDPTGGCFKVAPASKNCFEFYFVSRTELQAPGSENARPRWTARGTVEGSLDGCPDEANV